MNVIETLRAQNAVEEKPMKAVDLASKSIVDLNKMEVKDLIKTLRSETKKASSAHVNGGKIIFALDSKRDSKKSLTTWLTGELGEKPHDHALMCSVSFGMVGPGFGSVFEGEWDTTPLKWHLQISPILRFMEKEETPAETVAQIREEISEIIRHKPKDGEARLKEIKKLLKGPEDQKPLKEPGEPVVLQEEEIHADIDYLGDAIFEAMALAIDSCNDPKKLGYAMKSLFAMAKVSQAKIDVLMQNMKRATPVAAQAVELKAA